MMTGKVLDELARRLTDAHDAIDDARIIVTRAQKGDPQTADWEAASERRVQPHAPAGGAYPFIVWPGDPVGTLLKTLIRSMAEAYREAQQLCEVAGDGSLSGAVNSIGSGIAVLSRILVGGRMQYLLGRWEPVPERVARTQCEWTAWLVDGTRRWAMTMDEPLAMQYLADRVPSAWHPNTNITWMTSAERVRLQRATART